MFVFYLNIKIYFYMTKLNILFVFFLSFVTSIGVAQISGKVTDSKGEALIGASVIIEGTSVGTITDIDGNYNIQAQNGQSLVFAYVGYDSQTVTVAGQKVIDVTLTEGVQLESVVILGSRNPSRTAVNSPVAIDVFNIKDLQTASPQVNLNQILNLVAPSFNSNTQTISDGTDHIDPASLRGLGPDQVLVLVNGKRRHTSSLINVNGTFGRGSVGTDLNAIPAAAIDKIEY